VRDDDATMKEDDDDGGRMFDSIRFETTDE